MPSPPRIAFFPDSFHEVNGVAHTSRNFVAFAQRRGLPFLCVRAGLPGQLRTRPFEHTGELRTLELKRSPMAVGMEKDLTFDPIFWRHSEVIEDALVSFRPDWIHITGPSELGIFGAYFAWKLGIPLAASWHTNVHEYAGKRLDWLTRRLPNGLRVEKVAENRALDATQWFYRLGRVLFAPNDELCAMLSSSTGRPCHLMQRGVDTQLFHPARRQRPRTDRELLLGYVGRLSVEKNVSLLPQIQRQLDAAGIPARFLLVGHGAEEESLRRDLPTAIFAGVLRGEALAQAYANMDLLVFPSHTDTFGNVVLEALASGVPALVTPDGGPKFIVRDSLQTKRDSLQAKDNSTNAKDGRLHSNNAETGFIRPDDGFASAIAAIAADRPRLAAMGAAARDYALGCSWDAVFDRIYAAYSEASPAASLNAAS